MYHPTFNEAPWGGYKQCGIGREFGTYGYEAYTEVKQINTNLTPRGSVGSATSNISFRSAEVLVCREP